MARLFGLYPEELLLLGLVALLVYLLLTLANEQPPDLFKDLFAGSGGGGGGGSGGRAAERGGGGRAAGRRPRQPHAKDKKKYR
jgi:hypothetical protein